MKLEQLQVELTNVYDMISKLEIESKPNNIQILYVVYYKLKEMITQLENNKVEEVKNSNTPKQILPTE